MARILNITPAQYHLDPCITPSLSASVAKSLVNKSPAHVWLEHPRLGNKRGESTVSLNEGAIIHELVLGKGSGLVVIEANDFRTKAAQEQRDAAIADGKTPVIAKNMEGYEYAANKIRDNITRLIQRTIPTAREVCIEWTYDLNRRVPGTSDMASVLCRSMLDAVDVESGFILDLKTCESARQLSVERACCDYGYDIQGAAYTAAIDQLNPDVAGRTEMLFAFAEIKPPYSVTVGRFAGQMKMLGESRWNRAANKWYDCLTSGKWPHYADKIVTLYPPTYEIAREEEIRQCEL